MTIKEKVDQLNKEIKDIESEIIKLEHEKTCKLASRNHILNHSFYQCDNEYKQSNIELSK